MGLMRKDTFLMFVGVLIYAVPFVGVPAAWKDIALFVLGGAVLLVAIIYRLQHRKRTRARDATLHVEYRPPADADTTPV